MVRGVGDKPLKEQLFGNKLFKVSMERKKGGYMSCMVKDRYKAGLWNSIRKRWNIFNNKASFEVDMGEM